MRIVVTAIILALSVGFLAATAADEAAIAVAHVKWGMRGDTDADGTPRRPRNGVMMQVLVRRDGQWTVVAAQNTDVR